MGMLKAWIRKIIWEGFLSFFFFFIKFLFLVIGVWVVWERLFWWVDIDGIC